MVQLGSYQIAGSSMGDLTTGTPPKSKIDWSCLESNLWCFTDTDGFPEIKLAGIWKLKWINFVRGSALGSSLAAHTHRGLGHPFILMEELQTSLEFIRIRSGSVESWNWIGSPITQPAFVDSSHQENMAHIQGLQGHRTRRGGPARLHEYSRTAGDSALKGQGWPQSTDADGYCTVLSSTDQLAFHLAINLGLGDLRFPMVSWVCQVKNDNAEIVATEKSNSAGRTHIVQ